MVFTEYYKTEDGYYNSSLLVTVATTIRDGLRIGEGIAETMYKPTYGVDDTNTDYWLRFIFDFSFYIIMNVLFVNIIFGN